MKIQSAVLREPNKPLTIEELELDPPQEKEVLVKYAYTGFCHSDLHLMLGEIPIALPLAIGHEAAGVVEAVGPGVTKVQKGDHVVGTWMIPCGKCPQCLRGMGNICSGNFGSFLEGVLLDGTSRIERQERRYGAPWQFCLGLFDIQCGPGGRCHSPAKRYSPGSGLFHGLLRSDRLGFGHQYGQCSTWRLCGRLRPGRRRPKLPAGSRPQACQSCHCGRSGRKQRGYRHGFRSHPFHRQF